MRTILKAYKKHIRLLFFLLNNENKYKIIKDRKSTKKVFNIKKRKLCTLKMIRHCDFIGINSMKF